MFSHLSTSCQAHLTNSMATTDKDKMAEQPPTDKKDKPAGAGTGLVSRKLLDKIDRLFACNVGEHVDLPLLAVVGNQSSGKSSVLAALTGLPFPRAAGLCTRFATQIMFKRSQEKRFSVSIRPADKTGAYAEKLKNWRKPELKALDADTFTKIMEEVSSIRPK